MEVALQFLRGVKGKYWWFRIQRDDVPLGAHVEIDPSVVGASTMYFEHVWDTGDINTRATYCCAIIDDAGTRKIIAPVQHGVKCYNMSGSLLWTYTGITNGYDVYEIAVGDLLGSGYNDTIVICSGYYTTATDGKAAIVDSDGNQVQLFTGNDFSIANVARVYGAAIDGTDIYFATNKGIFKFAKSGSTWSESWAYELSDCSQIMVKDAGNGKKVFVAASPASNQGVYCLSTDGTLEWSGLTNNQYTKIFAIGKVDSTKSGLQIIVPYQQGVRIFDKDGNTLATITTGTNVRTGVTLYDCDGDGEDEIYFADMGRDVYCFERTGENTYSQKYSALDVTNSNQYAGLTHHDLDNDGDDEIYIFSTDGYLYVYHETLSFQICTVNIGHGTAGGYYGGYQQRGNGIYFLGDKLIISGGTGYVDVYQDKSSVGTSTIASATDHPFQRKTFYAAGRFWVFYSDGTNMVFRSSTNGEAWSSATTVRACGDGAKFSIYFDGTYVHYCYATYIDETPLYYRRGTPNSDGTISWTDECTAVAAESGVNYQLPYIAVDSAGYPWIGYHKYVSSEDGGYAYVTKSSTSDGTWSTASGFPYQLYSQWGCWFVIPVALTNQKMYIVYAQESNRIYGKLWTGSWGSEEKIFDDGVALNLGVSAVNVNDDVYLVHLSASQNLQCKKRTYGSGWGSVESVQSSVGYYSKPALSSDSSTGTIYCFWVDSNHLYYKKRASGVWDSSPTDWVSETNLWETQTAFYKDYGNYIGVAYTSGSKSPYNVKFAYLTLAAGEIVEKDFADGVIGADVFGIPFRAMPFADSGAGTDAFGIPFKAMKFLDSGSGIDVFQIFKSMQFSDSGQVTDAFQTPFKAMLFVDSGAGVDAFIVPFKALKFSDTGQIADVFVIPFKVLKFTDASEGVDAFNILFKAMGFSDSGSGIDVFALLRELVFSDSGLAEDVFIQKLVGWLEKVFNDAGQGIDAFTILFKAMKFSDIGTGMDVFSLLRELGFSDLGTGADVFLIPFKALKFSDSALGSDAFLALLGKSFADSGLGVDSFLIPFKSLGFSDLGHGSDTFLVLLWKTFADATLGSDAFTKELVGWLEKTFGDTGQGADAFLIPFKALRFSDSGQGVDAFIIPFKTLQFTDVGQGADVFSKFITFLNKVFSDAGYGSDAFAILFKALHFSDVGQGVDLFNIPFKAIMFTDAALGTDVFLIPFKEMKFSDTGHGIDTFSKFITFLNKVFSDAGHGSDVFVIPFKTLGFSDLGHGADLFFVLLWKGFSDTGYGVETFSKEAFIIALLRALVTLKADSGKVTLIGDSGKVTLAGD